jgi:O-antigen ligase
MTGPFLLFDRFRRKTVELLVTLSTSFLLAYLVLKYETTGLVLGIGFLVLTAFLVYQLQSNVSYRSSLFFIPLIVCSFPFQRLFLTTIPLVVAAQFLVFPLIMSYVAKFPAYVRSEYSQRIRPLLFPTLAFIFSFILAYTVSGEWAKRDWGFILSLLGSVGYAFLACVYCRDLKSLQKILWVLIGVGVIQLPVMYAMGRGWTDHLPGVLSKLSSESWGGLASASGSTTLRYPGLFRDYELLAEYLDLMALLCMGIALSTDSKRERIFSIGAAFFVTIAGFYTGTRAFAIGLGVGFTVMLILFVIQPDLWKKLKNIVILGIVLVLALYLLSTQGIFKGYVERFLRTDIRLGYYDSRTDVWARSFSMMNHLPFTGYGTQMTRMFENIGYASPHSLYLSMLLKAGFPGILAILILICAPFLWMARILLNRTRHAYHTWAIILLSVWSCWVINEVKIEFIRYPFYMNIIFFILGVTASYYHLARNKPSGILQQSV